MFDSVIIRNYRGLRYASIDGFKRINIFFGKNNCGKSSVLEAILLVAGQSNPSLPFKANALRGINRLSEQTATIDFYGADPKNTINVSAKGKPSRDLLIEMIRPDSQNININDLNSGTSDVKQKQFGLKATYKLNGEDITYSSRFIVSESNSEQGRNIVDKRYSENLNCLLIGANSYRYDIIELFSNVVKNKREQEIFSILRIIEPHLKDLQLVDNDLMADVGFPQRLPINVLGDGFRKVLRIVLSIYEYANGIVLIDEMDNGLHYSVMQKLWEAIFDTARKYNVQLFVSTHSIDLLRSLVHFLDTSSKTDYQSDVSAYKLFRKEDDEILAIHYDYTKMAYSVTQEIEMR